jgi:hypothetical protein
MIFCPRQRKYIQSVPLILNGIDLQRVTSTKFLGIRIDEKLSWKSHINDVASKISKNIGIINRLKKFLPSHVLLTLYNCFVLPYLSYSVLTWGGLPTQCNRLLTLQKRAVRIISNAGFLDHTTALFCNLKLLKFNDLYHLKLGKFMYKYMSNALPPCFSSFFTLTTGIHSYKTRSTSKKNLFVSRNRTSMYKNSLVQRGVTYWNNLDGSVKSAITLPIFSKKLKQLLLNAYSL